MTIKEKIQDLHSQVAGLQATNAEQLEALRIKYLSKKGQVTAMLYEALHRILATTDTNGYTVSQRNLPHAPCRTNGSMRCE